MSATETSGLNLPRLQQKGLSKETTVTRKPGWRSGKREARAQLLPSGGVSRCKHCSEESQVPGCLSGRWKHREEKPRTTWAVAGPHPLSKGNPGTTLRGVSDETTFATVRNKGRGCPSTLGCQSSPD